MSGFPFKTVAFDLDGTIADTAPDLVAALNAGLAAVDRAPLSLNAVRPMIGHGVRALLRNGLLATGGATDALVDAGFPALIAYYEDHICDHTKPFPGVEAAWDALAAEGVALAVCTNKLERLSRRLIEALGWEHRFAAIVGGDTLATCKPDAAPLHLAIARANGGPAAFVGDSIVDVETAKAAGVPCVAVSFGIADRPARELGADAVIDSFGELANALRGLAHRSAMA